ncbi:MAG TPA: gamma-glutamyltransferase, partial [Candidatus Binatia bacterium]|nr:gamma-glutamyltransferase [Candidatus Binatia bacterium]
MPGVIAAGNSQTAAAGAAILDQGGNAVDAAIAAAFTSFIAEVGVVHLGGSGFAQVFDPASGQHLVYDFFSNMPGAGSQVQNDRLDFQRVTIDYGSTTQDFHLGRGSVAVPGNIFGLCRLAADFGSLPLKALLGPAQKLADEGAVLDQFQADTCALLKPLYTNTPGMRAIFAPDGDMVQSGDIVRIPYLGDTLRLLIQVGEQYAREGALAQAILADQRQHGGLLTAKDLQAYQVRRQEPIRLPYRGYEILLPPPASTGGALTAFALKLLASFPINEVEHGSSAHLRLLAEVLAATGRARPFWDRAVVEESWQSAVDALMADDFIRPFVQDIRSSLETGRPSPVAQEAQGPAST